jgi:hypothetical protein
MLASASSIVLASGTAAAQSAEAHGFVEPCTIGNHQEMHTECELCALPEQDPDACGRRLGTLGYAKKCRTNVHSGPPAEVWCIATAALAAKPVKAKGTESTAKLIIAIAVSVALVGLFFFAKRRAKSGGSA